MVEQGNSGSDSQTNLLSVKQGSTVGESFTNLMSVVGGDSSEEEVNDVEKLVKHVSPHMNAELDEVELLISEVTITQ